jgi:hypothetical protein
MADACVADQHIHIRDLLKSGRDSGFVGHITADGGSAGFLGYRSGGFVIFFVKEEHPVTPTGKQPHCSCADTPGTAGDQNG